jgi:radical SAM-linked protein
LEAVVVDRKVPSLMSMIERASYQVRISCPIPGLEQRIEELLNRPAIEIEKQGKKGPRLVDIKPGIYELNLDYKDDTLLHMLVSSGSKGNIKPETVVQELLEQRDTEGFGEVLLHIHRDGQYIYKEGEWVSPLALKY